MLLWGPGHYGGLVTTNFLYPLLLKVRLVVSCVLTSMLKFRAAGGRLGNHMKKVLPRLYINFGELQWELTGMAFSIPQ